MGVWTSRDLIFSNVGRAQGRFIFERMKHDFVLVVREGTALSIFAVLFRLETQIRQIVEMH